MKKIELKLLGLSYSQTQIGSYIVVLSELKGKRKLPIIIKPAEAQVIALKVEGVKSPRPLTHDLFKNMMDAYMVDLQEVYIHTLAEGIFYSRLVTSNGIDEIEIECTAGDAIAMALIFDCPIFASKSVLDISGVYMDDNGEIDTSMDELVDDNDEKETKRIVSIPHLEKMIEDAIKQEEYEIAAELRDRISKLKSDKKA